MTTSVRLRERAAADLADAIEYYRRQASNETALEFVEAVERAIIRIGRNPEIGSLRFAFELGLPDLRAWPLRRFPYAVFYMDTPDVIDVWRILHARQDIPTSSGCPTRALDFT